MLVNGEVIEVSREVYDTIGECFASADAKMHEDHAIDRAACETPKDGLCVEFVPPWSQLGLDKMLICAEKKP